MRRWTVPAFVSTLALIGAGTLVWTDAAHLSAQSTEGDPDAHAEAHALMEKVIERVAWYVDNQIDARYRSRMRREVRRFHANGEVENESVGDFEVIPIEGEPFERLFMMNGRMLSEEEEGWVAESEAEFRREVIERRETGAEPEDDGSTDSIVFDEALIARYHFTIEGEEAFRNRPSYKVSFRPRPGRLPVVRRIDYALNSASGFVWVDRATFEPARVEFELIRPVRLWWGLLGVINRARGSLDRRPILGDDDLWARIQLDSYSDTRVVFSRTLRSEFRTWRDFEAVEH